MQCDAHVSMDEHLAWGIEAISSGGQVSFSCLVFVAILN
jgi:hypothetical protein